MSRRKIVRKKPSISRSKKPVYYSSGMYPIVDPENKVVGIFESSFKTSPRAARVWPEYHRAHELMPGNDRLFDPYGHPTLVPEAAAVLASAERRTSKDELLRAIGILGHTPTQESVETLTAFMESEHPLAPVAELALSECHCLVRMIMPPLTAS